MLTHTTKVHELMIYAYYGDVPIEVDPVLVGGSAWYTEGAILDHRFIALVLDDPAMPDRLIVGATYCALGVDPEGKRLRTHWFYCTALEPQPTFGVALTRSIPNGSAPLIGDISQPWIYLEQLSDLKMTWASPPPSFGISQNQIGQTGWLVMTSLTTPSLLGVLVEDPVLPPIISKGSENIAISAKCNRTLQSIGFEALRCVDAGETAVFLESATA